MSRKDLALTPILAAAGRRSWARSCRACRRQPWFVRLALASVCLSGGIGTRFHDVVWIVAWPAHQARANDTRGVVLQGGIIRGWLHPLYLLKIRSAARF